MDGPLLPGMPSQQVITATAIAQPAQYSSDPRRPLDSRILAMPRAEQKLEVIHHRSQLVVTRGPIRKIAWSDQSILDVVQFSPTEISILGMTMGTTDLWLWFEGQEQPLMYVVTVIRDPSLEEQRKIDYGRIERKLALLYPNSKVYLIPMSRKIIVRGQAKDSQEAANIMQVVRGEVIAREGMIYGIADLMAGDLGGAGGGAGFGFDAQFNNNALMNSFIVDELQIPGEFLILIRVRIAEVSRSQLRRLGFDWQGILRDGAYVVRQSFGAGSNPTMTGVFDNGNVTILLDALAANGSARILEDTQLVTLSGEAAAFLAGGEFAVPTVVGVGGAQGQQTSFRGFGTSVIATPTLVDHDLIRLQIVPELSAVNGGNSVGGIPGVDVKRVQTRVELREGQSIMLGGLFSRRERAENARIPFIGEIPVIGTFLFHSKQATEDENELLIIVTPEIVRPMDPDQTPPLPGWYVTHPDDIDFYKYNRIEGNPDLGNYQLLPYGNGQGYGRDVGYNYFNPPPADGQLNPAVTGGATLSSPGLGSPAQQLLGPGYMAPPSGPTGPAGMYSPGLPPAVPPAHYGNPGALPTPAAARRGQQPTLQQPTVQQVGGVRR